MMVMVRDGSAGAGRYLASFSQRGTVVTVSIAGFLTMVVLIETKTTFIDRTTTTITVMVMKD